MMITYGLMEALDDVADASPETARVVNKATVTELLRDASGKVVGVEYTKKGKSFKEYGSVVLATGGFGADFSADSLLSSVAQDWRGLAVWDSMDHKLLPDLGDLPTTNGPHCTGDGIKMATSLGAGVRDLHCVQVHPTGIIDPDDKGAKVKRLAAEALRGHGGILLDRDGNRFANELGKRDYVSGRMWAQNRAPYRLVLNSASESEIAWHCKHYKDNGLMKKLSGKELAADMGIPYSKLEQTFGEYSASATQHKATGEPDKWGKVFFEYSPGGTHVADSPVVADDHFHVAHVTPIVHYCMGGISTSAAGEVLTTGEQPIAGLFAAGEVIGGIHGVNRLGGSSLLDCVVYGRLAGASAAKSVGQGTGNINDLTGKGPGPGGPSVVAAPTSSGAPAVYTMAEVAQHTTKDDCWVVVDGNVYDVTEVSISQHTHPLRHAPRPDSRCFVLAELPQILFPWSDRSFSTSPAYFCLGLACLSCAVLGGPPGRRPRDRQECRQRLLGAVPHDAQRQDHHQVGITCRALPFWRLDVWMSVSPPYLSTRKLTHLPPPPPFLPIPLPKVRRRVQDRCGL